MSAFWIGGQASRGFLPAPGAIDPFTYWVAGGIDGWFQKVSTGGRTLSPGGVSDDWIAGHDYIGVNPPSLPGDCFRYWIGGGIDSWWLGRSRSNTFFADDDAVSVIV